jgi:hypothetical protein
MKIKLIGVYPIESHEPCHLIEMTIHGIDIDLDMGLFTQEDPEEPVVNWQVPYDEHFLNSDGSKVLNPNYPDEVPDDHNLRVAFCFHYLDFQRPIKTPVGDLELPEVTKIPERLKILEYDPPD